MNSVLEHYQALKPSPDLLFRADSGFAVPELYDLCEAKEVEDLIRLKSNAILEAKAQKIDQKLKLVNRIGTNAVYEFSYQAVSWQQPRRVCVISEHKEGLFVKHTFVVTNLSPEITSRQVIAAYRKRGQMENYIKEAKNGHALDKTDSTSFLKHTARSMISMLAYNLMNLMQRLTYPPHEQQDLIGTIRNKLLKIGAKIVHSGRQIKVKLSSVHPYQELFDQILRAVQNLKPT